MVVRALLASEYLGLSIAAGKSPYTLRAERSALRLFFDDRQLASSVAIPARKRAAITRSRRLATQDRHLQPANWQPLICFLQATGLSRREVSLLKCRDIKDSQNGHVHVLVTHGRGGTWRRVPVLPGREAEVVALVEGRDPEALVFDRIPTTLDVQSYRREFAQALYLHHARGRSLPQAQGRLRPADYDRAAVQLVAQAMGHQRIDLALRHYLRLGWRVGEARLPGRSMRNRAPDYAACSPA